MGVRWLAVIGWACLIGAALPAAVPTQDTMVVARSDDGYTSTAAETLELTTEEPMPPIKLTDMEVTSEISLRYAQTAVVATVRNPAKRSQEATFRVLLPETAFISGFVMTLNGKNYKAYVKEKEEAQQIYNQAVSQGLGAAHVAAKARDSNQFTVSVNVEPDTVGVFNLTYEELLTRRNGVYNHAINLHPGALVPRLSVTVLVKEAQKITTLRVPEVRTGNEIDATEEDAQNTKAIIERNSNDREAKVVFKPTIEEQQRLIDIYREKSKETRPQSFSYDYEHSDDDKKDTDGILGQFVVQYDVERPKDGEILVNNGYFVHFFAPTDLPPLNKHVVFVLDTSGSMMDRKIVQLREAMQTILSELKPGDYFNLVEFSSSVKVYEMAEADKEAPVHSYYNFPEQTRDPKLVPPSPATPDNVARAKVIVSRLYASGGTNIYSALDVAVSLIKKGVGWTDAPQNDTKKSEVEPLAVTTEETVKESTTVAAEAKQNPSLSPEPIIIFLTDGDPTVGVSDPTRITNHITEKNSGYNKATIFSLAFGEDADRKFLRKLSLRNEGFVRHIYEAADAALQLRDFYRQVSSPLLAHVKFVYPKKQVKGTSITKHEFRRFYAGSETIVAGRVADDATELEPQVLAFCGVIDGEGTKPYEITPKATVPVRKEKFLPLERLWAFLTVRQLLDERDAADRKYDDKDEEDLPDKKALDLALKYEFVTPLTSLVVVKPNETAAIDAESVHKQSKDNINYAAFGGAPASALLPVFDTALSKAVGMALPQYAFSSLPGLPGAPASSQGFPASGQGYIQFSQVAPFSAQGPGAAYSPFAPGAGGGSASMIGVPLAAPTQGTGFSPIVEADSLFAMEDTYDYNDSRPQSTPLTTSVLPLSTTPGPKSTQSTPAADPLAPYCLQGYDWLRPLLDADADTITLKVNATDVILKLQKDEGCTGVKSAGSEQKCPAGETGATGQSCVYLSRCSVARTLTAETYASSYCLVDERYAGVCCADAAVGVAKPI